MVVLLRYLNMKMLYVLIVHSILTVHRTSALLFSVLTRDSARTISIDLRGHRLSQHMMLYR